MSDAVIQTFIRCSFPIIWIWAFFAGLRRLIKDENVGVEWDAGRGHVEVKNKESK